MINRVYGAYFSGTDTTKKVVTSIGKFVADKLDVEYVEWNFTLPHERETKKVFCEDDLVIFGTPVIAGRVSNLLLTYLKSIDGGNALAVPIVLYGNRNYDDALIELKDILEGDGMRVIAGGAFIGEHSFSKELAKGRPNEDDLKVAHKLSDIITQKIISGKVNLTVNFPGTPKPYRPYYTPRDRYGNHIDIRKVKPKTKMEKCDDCKLCAQICPLGSIEFVDVSRVTGICMKCCGCIKKCHVGAKYFDDEGYIYHKEELEAEYKEPKEVEIFS